jgi:hypothetical protein
LPSFVAVRVTVQSPLAGLGIVASYMPVLDSLGAREKSTGTEVPEPGETSFALTCA